jgi:hypothetical protein
LDEGIIDTKFIVECTGEATETLVTMALDVEGIDPPILMMLLPPIDVAPDMRTGVLVLVSITLMPCITFLPPGI